MYRNGAFTGLKWDSICENHKCHWNYLKSYFGFSDEILFLNTRCLSRQTTLDDLAENCICQCRDLLFSLKPIECLPMHNSRYDGNQDFSFTIRTLMEQSLIQALSTHLIVTFAYRFFCENLEKQSLNRYSNILFDCKNAEYVPKDKLQMYEDKKSEYNNWKRKYKSFFQEMGIETEKTKENENTPHEENKNPPKEGTFLADLQDVASDVVATQKFIEVLKEELSFKRISPPCIWTLMLVLSERIHFLNAFGENVDGYLALTELVSNAELTRSLLSEEMSFQDKQVDVAPVLFSTFVGIPINSSMSKDLHIPDEQYPYRGGKGTAIISSRLQKAFNNYAIERTFHLRAMATAEFYMRKFRTTAKNTSGLTMLKPLDLHAPLVQSEFISFISNTSDLSKRPEIVEHYIRRWNRIALPMLEELFIWSMGVNFPTIVDVETAIQRWIEADSNYERANIIRVLPAKKLTPLSGSRELREFHNSIVNSAFRVSDNLKYDAQ